MQVHKTKIPGVLVLEPQVFHDNRGLFFESWNQNKIKEQAGINEIFVQDNHSRSTKGVLRGLHYQLKNPQGKLVRVTSGKVLDVALDLRRSSPTFGQHFSVELSDRNHKQLWMPAGIVHGFLTLSDSADLAYKATNYYFPKDERTIFWNDLDLKIDWNLNGITPIVSKKDQEGGLFSQADYYK